MAFHVYPCPDLIITEFQDTFKNDIWFISQVTYPRSRKDSNCLVFKCLGSPLVFTATASNSSKDGGTNKSRQFMERIDVMPRLAKV